MAGGTQPTPGVRRRRRDEAGCHAVLHPALVEAARRAGATTVGLVDVGRPAGLNLAVDRVGISYSNGQVVGDPSSPVQVSAAVVGDRSLPVGPMPEVAARIVVDVDPIDVTDPEEARWLRAGLPVDRPDRRAALDGELALAAAAPPLLVQGDVDALPEAIGRVPGEVLPVVITTWVLARLPLEGRLRFLHRLDDVAARRPVAWVSVEGVGVAPAVPTLGDRRASGHSTIGVALFDGPAVRVEAVGRCWSRGRHLSWLADQ